LIVQVVSEPLILLTLPAIPALLERGDKRWRLLITFVIVSFLLQALADVQAGGNINYFFEGLFALVPVAVVGAYQLIEWSQERPAFGALLSAFLLIHLIMPEIRDLYGNRAEFGSRAIDFQNEEFRRESDVLRGRHVLSFIPRFALLDAHPAIIEPYLMTYLERLGKFDPAPLLDRIDKREFDVVLARSGNARWRGIPLMPPLFAPIERGYRRECAIRDTVVYLPRDRETDAALVQGLKSFGCVGQ